MTTAEVSTRPHEAPEKRYIGNTAVIPKVAGETAHFNHSFSLLSKGT
jgi:hypothetical protein